MTSHELQELVRLLVEQLRDMTRDRDYWRDVAQGRPLVVAIKPEEHENGDLDEEQRRIATHH